MCNAGAVIGYRAAPDATPGQVLAAAGSTIASRILGALERPHGPVAGACARAAEFLRGWWGEPPSPPFSPAR